MSEHSEIVRSYIELRNYLAQSNPQPNMEFEVNFKIEGTSLFAFNTISKAKTELAKIQPNFFRLYSPPSGVRFEPYSFSLMSFLNKRINLNGPTPVKDQIVSLAQIHKRSLALKKAYEPRDK